MGYFLTTEAETAVSAQSPASPKTHVPLSRLQERGFRFYSASMGRWVSREADDNEDESAPYTMRIFHSFDIQWFSTDLNKAVYAATEVAGGEWKCFTDDGELGRDGFQSKTGEPVPKPRFTVANKTCTSECTKTHEQQHETDFGPCCDRAQAAWKKAAKQFLFCKSAGLIGGSHLVSLGK